jgi:hypothetical protein
MIQPAADPLAQVPPLLAEQLTEVRRGRFDVVQAIGRRIDDLLRQATEDGVLRGDEATRQHIRELQSELELALKQRMSDVGQARTRLRRGKTTLQAYRRGIA